MIKNKLISSLKSIITKAIIITANMFAVLIANYIIPDFSIGNIYNAIIIVVAVDIANSLLWPVFRRFSMKFIFYTFGIGAVIINSTIFYIATYFIPEVHVGLHGFFDVPLMMAIATTLVTHITNTNYYDTYIKRISDFANKQKSDEKTYSGILMLEIDGLSINTLKKAIENGVMPTVKMFIDEKTHNLKEWETDLSSQTGASQAGILHGNNKNIVAYRWVEKENNNKIIVSSSLSDSPKIEKRISNGEGLLVNGISISNMFSGDSKIATLTSSKFQELKREYTKPLTSVFLDSYNSQRIVILFLWDIIIETKSKIVHYIKNIKPRIRRTIIYAAIRAGANVVLREVTTDVLTSEILTGQIDTAYATYMGYDEVAHHSGVEDVDVWSVLKQIDIQFQRILSAIEMSDRNYEIVVLSDHGQSNGATFKQRYNVSLGNYVRSLLPDDLKIFKNEYNIDHFRDAIPQNKQIKNIKKHVEDLFDEEISFRNLKEELESIKPSIIFENEQYKNLQDKYSSSLDYIRNHESTHRSSKKAKNSELIVLASGNLGLIYLTQWHQRLNYEEIVMLFPDLIPGLVNHPGIGFILVNSITNGGMVIGENGIYYLNNDKVVGENPLRKFGVNAARHLKRHNSFDNMPDILVNSFYDSENDEVCAFEELIGSHGGLGGNQSKAFILYPSKWDAPEELIGSESIYKFLKNEINKLDS